MNLRTVAVGTHLLEISGTLSLDDVRHFLEEHAVAAEAIAVVFEPESLPAVGVIATPATFREHWSTTAALRRYLADFGVCA
ncbi:hypothetical protein [Burkholderia cenocepacia]|uniref:hypothetical protein n=1 Tax=Burkholderia cenocepacia TaxID=95486 RepID=UPI000761C63E|nr:hypothetical protein [Burkholderia cenocepacia]KWU26349.1 hypothetical protein AS149_25505 [Burkholderia cenocepacia]